MLLFRLLLRLQAAPLGIDAMSEGVHACEPRERTPPNRVDPAIEKELGEHRLASALAYPCTSR